MAFDSRQQSACYRWLEKNTRLHAQHGPIDLIIEIQGAESERILAFKQAMVFFESVLAGLVNELALLRMPIADTINSDFQSVVAKHMQQSVANFTGTFVTPMAAVAGSVADCTLAAMCHNRDLTRAFVNNGGDIALHLADTSSYTVGICESSADGVPSATAQIDQLSLVRGVATSGWQGRSHSLGIADAVTVLASNAAAADVAATLIANRIDLPGSTKVHRVAASELSEESDLGTRAVTVDVLPLTAIEKQQALFSGQCYAQSLVSQQLIDSAFLSLQGQRVVAGNNPIIQWRRSA